MDRRYTIDDHEREGRSWKEIDGCRHYQYQGEAIVRTAHSRYCTPNLRWGEQPGEYHTFRTLTAAKAFIDRQQF